MLVNSATYYGHSSPVDSTVVTGGPCSARMVDVKMTETDLPWYFKLANVPFIDAHARVTIFQADTRAGSLPIGVPDVNPRSAKITFVDESTDPPTVLGSRDLSQGGQRRRSERLGQHGLGAAGDGQHQAHRRARRPRGRLLDHLRPATGRVLRRRLHERHPLRAGVVERRQRRSSRTRPWRAA